MGGEVGMQVFGDERHVTRGSSSRDYLELRGYASTMVRFRLAKMVSTLTLAKYDLMYWVRRAVSA